MKLNTGSFMTCRYTPPHETGETSANSTADAYYIPWDMVGVKFLECWWEMHSQKSIIST